MKCTFSKAGQWLKLWSYSHTGVLGLVFDKIRRAWVCPLAVTGLIPALKLCVCGPGTGTMSSGLCQARLSVRQSL